MSEGDRKTPLYDRHVARGARMIPFAGWMMPVQYTGIIDEHNLVRNKAGLFDLGHMGQVEVGGPDALAFLQEITTNDVSLLEPGQAQYSMLPTPTGGVIDDIFIYRHHEGPGYFVCVNASNRERDVAWMQEQRSARPELDVTVEDISDNTGMIAIQGPKAVEITQRLTDTDLSATTRNSWIAATVAGIDLMLARTGYTGEDGFEFYCPIESVVALWDALIEAGEPDGLQPIGLGARDTLRLEARMPLYGQELAEDISPLEAGLGWAVALDKASFIGADPLRKIKGEGVRRKTVGFRLLERGGSPRSHYDVAVDGKVIGHVTSGAMSPTLGENIGIALIESEYAGVGKPLEIIVRGKPVRAVQVKVPFYKRTY
ncbi:MAG: glycine cleavage system aminomethyltransferase GcvT [Thermomicrobiales bacterium]|nr:glycine cleavage system aminomethyltransferase GcvT [Thermomicrobiales bacterium]